MGGGESKSESMKTHTASETQEDSLLDLLNKATIQRDIENKELLAKLTKKLETVSEAQKFTTTPNDGASLHLKCAKLKFKIKKSNDSYESDTKFLSTIRQIYTDCKEKLLSSVEEKIAQVANLNINLSTLHAEVDKLKHAMHNQEIAFKAELRAKESECVVQKKIVATLKQDVQNHAALQSANFKLGIELANFKRESDLFKLRNEECTRSLTEKNVHVITLTDKQRKSEKEIVNLEALNAKMDSEIRSLKIENVDLSRRQISDNAKYDNLFERWNSKMDGLEAEKESDILKYKQEIRESNAKEGNLRTLNAKLDKDQSKYKQEIMFLKSQIAELSKRQVSDDSQCNELRQKHDIEVQKNKDLSKDISTLNTLLTNNVKLTIIHQRGTLLQLTDSIHGMKTDLLYLVPNLNERTIPTAFECNKELEKLDGLLNKTQENLNRLVAYHGRFESFVYSKQPLANMDKVPNILSGIELPCSFLHLKFLPLFKTTFSIMEPQEANSHFPRPLMKFTPTTNNINRGAYHRTKQYSPRNYQNNDGNQAGPSRGRPIISRGKRGGHNQNRPRGTMNNNSNTKPNRNHAAEGIGTSNCGSDDSDADSTSGVTLTVLTNGSVGGSDRTVQRKPATEVEDCFICCESLTTKVKMLEDCEHKYHTYCIDEWFESNTECPKCSRDDD